MQKTATSTGLPVGTMFSWRKKNRIRNLLQGLIACLQVDRHESAVDLALRWLIKNNQHQWVWNDTYHITASLLAGQIIYTEGPLKVLGASYICGVHFSITIAWLFRGIEGFQPSLWYFNLVRLNQKIIIGHHSVIIFNVFSGWAKDEPDYHRDDHHNTDYYQRYLQFYE